MLFLGNSYTFQGALDDVVEAMYADAGAPVVAERLAEPGWTFTRHVEAIETDGSVWQLAFDAPRAWVVLQEQSQIPGFPEGQADLVASRDAAVALDGLATANGARTLFLMTWGRRDGDEQNAALYPDFPTMQEALAAGYLDYAALASADGTPAWVAPAGLAWARVYDEVVAGGGDPLDPTSAFYGLYVSDGSHPSQRGTYLTACVVYASLTGESPVGLGAPEGVADAAYLQGVAAQVVFDGEGIVYPWESAEDTGVDIGGEVDTGGDTGAPDTDPSGDTDDTSGAPTDTSGCGCDTSQTSAGWLALALAVGAAARARALQPPSIQSLPSHR